MQKYTKIALSLIIPLYMLYCSLSPSEWHFVDNLNLIFHEAGHTIFFFMPMLFTIMAGSMFQVFIPLLLTFHFLIKGENVSSSIFLAWVGQSLINVSVYAKDSVVMQLPLLGGESVIHDWNYIMSTLNILKYTPQAWAFIYFSGILIIVVSIILVVYNSLKSKTESRLYADQILYK